MTRQSSSDDWLQYQRKKDRYFQSVSDHSSQFTTATPGDFVKDFAAEQTDFIRHSKGKEIESSQKLDLLAFEEQLDKFPLPNNAEKNSEGLQSIRNSAVKALSTLNKYVNTFDASLSLSEQLQGILQLLADLLPALETILQSRDDIVENSYSVALFYLMKRYFGALRYATAYFDRFSDKTAAFSALVRIDFIFAYVEENISNKLNSQNAKDYLVKVKNHFETHALVPGSKRKPAEAKKRDEKIEANSRRNERGQDEKRPISPSAKNQAQISDNFDKVKDHLKCLMLVDPANHSDWQNITAASIFSASQMPEENSSESPLQKIKKLVQQARSQELYALYETIQRIPTNNSVGLPAYKLYCELRNISLTEVAKINSISKDKKTLVEINRVTKAPQKRLKYCINMATQAKNILDCYLRSGVTALEIEQSINDAEAILHPYPACTFISNLFKTLVASLLCGVIGVLLYTVVGSLVTGHPVGAAVGAAWGFVKGIHVGMTLSKSDINLTVVGMLAALIGGLFGAMKFFSQKPVDRKFAYFKAEVYNNRLNSQSSTFDAPERSAKGLVNLVYPHQI